jgi:hypothetical protein
MLFKRYFKRIFFILLFAPVFLGAQTRHYTDRFDKYRIFFTLPDSTHYERSFFVEDSLSGNVVELNVRYARNAQFKNGFIEVRESDVWALFTVDGKLLAHFCHYIKYYPDNGLALANSYGQWQLFNSKGDIVASNDQSYGCRCWEPLYGEPAATGEVFSAPGCARGKFALMDKTGTWITEPVFDSIGKFMSGKAVAKYNGHKGSVNTKGVFTYSDSTGKISLGGMQKEFDGMGPPYKYRNKSYQIVYGHHPPVQPPITSVPPTANPPKKIISPPVASKPIQIAPVNPVQKIIRKDTTNILAFHLYTYHSHYKILWRYSDISKDHFPVRDTLVNHYESAKDYFLVDTLSHDTICLIKKTNVHSVGFSPALIHFNYYGLPSKIFTYEGLPFLPNAGTLTFDINDSIIIANKGPKGWSIYNWKQELLYTDSTLTWSEANPMGALVLITGKIVDTLNRITLYSLIKPNGTFITEPLFYRVERFDSTGLANATLCNGQTGKVNVAGKFRAEGSREWQTISIASLLADTAYSNIRVNNRGDHWTLIIHPYCYDKHTRVLANDGNWNYERYYLNGKLIAEEKHKLHSRPFNIAKHIRKITAKVFSHKKKTKQKRSHERAGKQIITYRNGDKKTKMVNKHYTRRHYNMWP